MSLRDLLGLRRNRGTSRRILTVAVLCAGAAAVMVAAAIAATTATPFDNYLLSGDLNQGKPNLNSTGTLVYNENTTNATVQSNLLNPCGATTCPAGPAEPSSFQGVGYGKTVWFDFYPQKSGLVEINIAGFDSVLCLYTFNRHSPYLPNIGGRHCVHESSAPEEELEADVSAHTDYTFQIGGVDATNGVPTTAAAGPLQLKFDYYISPTPRISADSILTASPLTGGIRLLGLNVSASRATQIKVRCSRGCRSETKKGGGSVNFPGLRGSLLTAGSKLEIFATKKNTIGAYIQYNIVNGNFTKFSRCLEPGSMIPRMRCH